MQVNAANMPPHDGDTSTGGNSVLALALAMAAAY
jgi:hypothetical protein